MLYVYAKINLKIYNQFIPLSSSNVFIRDPLLLVTQEPWILDKNIRE